MFCSLPYIVFSYHAECVLQNALCSLTIVFSYHTECVLLPLCSLTIQSAFCTVRSAVSHDTNPKRYPYGMCSILHGRMCSLAIRRM